LRESRHDGRSDVEAKPRKWHRGATCPPLLKSSSQNIIQGGPHPLIFSLSPPKFLPSHIVTVPTRAQDQLTTLKLAEGEGRIGPKVRSNDNESGGKKACLASGGCRAPAWLYRRHFPMSFIFWAQSRCLNAQNTRRSYDPPNGETEALSAPSSRERIESHRTSACLQGHADSISINWSACWTYQGQKHLNMVRQGLKKLVTRGRVDVR